MNTRSFIRAIAIVAMVASVALYMSNKFEGVGSFNHLSSGALRIKSNQFDINGVVGFSNSSSGSTPSTSNVDGGNNLTDSAVGYFNLSCPFEMSKFSCAFYEYNDDDRERTRASTEYYKNNLEIIDEAIRNAFVHNNDQRPVRILMSGDSLLRQLFIALVCNAATLYGGLIEHIEIPWKEKWPCPFKTCKISGGQHGGFDPASVRFRGGMELHWVPHIGYEDNILERFAQELQKQGTLTFGQKTAMKPGGPVDILVFNVGVHFLPDVLRNKLNYFVNNIATPLMQGASTTKRPRLVYIKTPTQHFNTTSGIYEASLASKQCIDEVPSNPRANIEKETLEVGVNIDVIIDYDDLNYGYMKMGKGDCTHYCMPGVPDVVAAELLGVLIGNDL